MANNKKEENAFDKARDTIYNVTHANQIAEEKRRAEKAAKNATACGIVGVCATAIIAAIRGHKRRKFIEETSIEDRKALEHELKELDEKYVELENKYKEAIRNA